MLNRRDRLLLSDYSHLQSYMHPHWQQKWMLSLEMPYFSPSEHVSYIEGMEALVHEADATGDGLQRYGKGPFSRKIRYPTCRCSLVAATWIDRCRCGQ